MNKIIRTLRLSTSPIIVAFVSGVSFAVGYFVYGEQCESAPKIWINLLFIIPVLYFCLFPLTIPDGSWLKTLWLGLVLFASLIHNASWCFFASLDSKVNQNVGGEDFILKSSKILANVNLGWSGAIIFLSLFIVSQILTNTKLVATIKKEPFRIVCLFLMLFIYVTYSLAFCLALHDRAVRLLAEQPSLTMEGPVAVDPSRRGLDEVGKASEINEWCFLRNGSIMVELINFEPGNGKLNLDHVHFEKLGELDAQHDECGSGNISIKNACAIHDVRKILMCQDPEVPIQFIVEIRAQSLTLAETMISETKKNIDGKLVEFRRNDPALPWPVVRWIVNSKVAEKDQFLRLEVGPISSSRWTMAPRKPELLDYFYFTIYTITTTGYGDIRPTDDFSKFVTTVANFYELFFIVIVFNVLLSIRRDDKSSPAGASNAGGQPEPPTQSPQD